MIGTHVSHYKILDKVGAGGTYLAEDEARRRKIALKILPPELDDPESLRRFKRESGILRRLDHPNIARIHSVEEDGGTRFVTMEWLIGRPLSKVLDGGGLDLATFFELATEIVQALAATHAREILHRDLKPPNVFVTENGHVKLLDFGLTQLEDDTDSAERLIDRGSLFGSMPYMSPERVRGEDATPASDVFSFGVLGFQMLTGKRPFSGLAWAAAMAILREEPRPLRALRPAVPAALAEVIHRCLAKNAAERYASAVELAPALAAARRETEENGGDGARAAVS